MALMARRGTAVVALALVALLAAPPAVRAGGEMANEAMKGRAMAKSRYGFDETVSRIKQAIEAQQMMVLFTADHQAMLQMVGLTTRGMLAIEFFHPRYGKAIYQGDQMAGIEPPLKVILMEGDMGTMVAYYKPSHIFARYPKLKALGDELDGVLATIAEAVTK